MYVEVGQCNIKDASINLKRDKLSLSGKRFCVLVWVRTCKTRLNVAFGVNGVCPARDVQRRTTNLS